MEHYMLAQAGRKGEDMPDPKRPKRPRDIKQLAYELVRESTEEQAHVAIPASVPEKNPAAVALGKLGAVKGGKARAKKLSPEERSKIARLAAAARWKKR